MELLDRLKTRIPDAAEDAELLSELIQAAGDAICAYTGRAEVPAPLTGVQVALAAIYYNRMGMEGETAHAEGGVSRTVAPLPEDLRRQINPWRLAKGVRG